MSQSRAPRPSRTTRAAERTWRRKLGAFGGALALTGGLVSACSSGSGSPEKPNLNVGIVSGIGAATFQLGNNQKLFDQQGLSLNITTYATDSALESALQKGQIDIAFGDYSEILNSVATTSSAAAVQVVGEGYDAGENTIGLVTSVSSSLKGLAITGDDGLAAKIAGGAVSVDVPNLSSPEYLALASWAIAQQNPLSSADVRAAENGQDGPTTAQAMTSAVYSGSAGTAVLQEPYLTEAIESGKFTELANLDSGNADDMPIAGYFALRATAQKDPNTIAAFQAALAQAQALGQSRVQIEAALTAAKVSAEVAATTSIGNYPTGIVAANLSNVLSLMGSANLPIANLDAGELTGSSDS